MGNMKLVILLLEKGADVNAPASPQEGRMALDGAAEHGRLDTVQLLLTFGATSMVP
jgi:ankyrin repeat protein